MGNFPKVPVLDHGYVQLVESWGSDERIIEAARMSTDKGFQGWGPESRWRCDLCGYQMDVPHNDRTRPVAHYSVTCGNTTMRYVSGHNGDEKLLKYLYTHKHSSPFEFCGLVVEIQAPIMVFREWHRHRTQSYAELSARYTPIPDFNYMPTIERLMMTSGTNKQAQSTGQQLTPELAEEFRRGLIAEYAAQEGLYQLALTSGVPKELARLVLPVGRYSRMRASANLRNWLAFLTLRLDPAAQWEIRQYAGVVGDLIAVAFPRTWQLFNVTGPSIT